MFFKKILVLFTILTTNFQLASANDPVVATVNNKKILKSEFDQYFRQTQLFLSFPQKSLGCLIKPTLQSFDSHADFVYLESVALRESASAEISTFFESSHRSTHRAGI